MALTRRTSRFGELAGAVDERVQAASDVAAFMDVSPRTALGYAPDDLPDTVARSIVLATKTLDDTLRRGHLRLVR